MRHQPTVRTLAPIAAIAAVLAAGPALAHPHVWVSSRSEVVYENNTIVGIRQSWTFDEFYTSMAIQGLDTNNDNAYDRKELEELAKVNVDGLKDFQFFTQAKLSSQALEFDEPKDYYLEHAEAASPPGPAGDAAAGAAKKDDAGFWSKLKGSVLGKTEAPPEKVKVLSLHFTLPLKQPVLAEAENFSFAVYDPSFFIWFETAAGGATLGAGAPKGCKAVVQAGEKDGADLQKLGESFYNQLGGANVGAGVAKTITVSCPKS